MSASGANYYARKATALKQSTRTNRAALFMGHNLALRLLLASAFNDMPTTIGELGAGEALAICALSALSTDIAAD
jgi:hypothetical protein